MSDQPFTADTTTPLSPGCIWCYGRGVILPFGQPCPNCTVENTLTNTTPLTAAELDEIEHYPYGSTPGEILRLVAMARLALEWVTPAPRDSVFDAHPHRWREDVPSQYRSFRCVLDACTVQGIVEVNSPFLKDYLESLEDPTDG